MDKTLQKGFVKIFPPLEYSERINKINVDQKKKENISPY
jgi:hypothetical protein